VSTRTEGPRKEENIYMANTKGQNLWNLILEKCKNEFCLMPHIPRTKSGEKETNKVSSGRAGNAHFRFRCASNLLLMKKRREEGRAGLITFPGNIHEFSAAFRLLNATSLHIDPRGQINSSTKRSRRGRGKFILAAEIENT